MRPPIAAAAAALLALAGCAVGPDYERPAVAEPPSLAGAPVAAGGIRVTTGPALDTWWRVFRDPQLDSLVERARAGNEDLKAALARVREARAVAREAFAPLLPEVGADGDWRYFRVSQNASPGGDSDTRRVRRLIPGSADLGYELDIFGGNRRRLETAEALEAASEEDRKALEISVIAETAEAYFDLGEAEAALAIVREALESRRRSLDLVTIRKNAGIAPDLDLRRAEGQLKAAAAEVPEAERRRQVAEHRLAILIGRTPDLRFEGKPPRAFALPPEVPVGIPSQLLERRPDVRAAEARLRAESARIGAAYADFFPRVTIVGRFGYASLSGETLLEPAAQLFSIGPSIRIPIFEGGATCARWHEALARTDEATALYRQATLRAFGDVADALSGLAGHLASRDLLAEQVAAEESALALATDEYSLGLRSFLDVLDSQRTLLLARLLLLRAERAVLGDFVALGRALGGGWTEIGAERT